MYKNTEGSWAIGRQPCARIAAGGGEQQNRIEHTPMQRLRQLDPSWFRRGQTTSLLASEIEKEEVNEDLGGILTTASAPPFDSEVAVRGGAYQPIQVVVTRGSTEGRWRGFRGR